MFKMSLSVAAFVALSPMALAYENYIPLGAGYSSSVESLPEFDSDAGQVSRRTDEYETELYLESRKKAQDESRMRDFFSDRNATGVDNHIDY